MIIDDQFQELTSCEKEQITGGLDIIDWVVDAAEKLLRDFMKPTV